MVLQTLLGQAREKLDRIVVDLSPELRMKVAVQLHYFRMPGPVEILAEFVELVGHVHGTFLSSAIPVPDRCLPFGRQ